MKREEVILEFSKDIFDSIKEKECCNYHKYTNAVLIGAAMRLAFVNESCKSTKR